MSRARWITVCGVFAAAVALLVFLQEPRGGGEGFPLTPSRLPREFAGVVLAGGEPVGGATVLLFEDVDGGFSAETATASDGSFRLAWTPTATTDLRRLYLRAENGSAENGRAENGGAENGRAENGDNRRVSTVAAADPGGTILRLAEAVACRGKILTHAGAPLAGVEVRVSAQHDPAEPQAATTDADGAFALPGPVPRGAPLDVVVADGFPFHYEGRFRGGDTLVLHVGARRRIDLFARDPDGEPVLARARLSLPRSLEPVAGMTSTGRLTAFSDGRLAFVTVAAEGYLPVEVPAWPGRLNEVILWPARDVEVLAWDAWNRRGVERVSFEVDLHPPEGEDEEWWGKEAGRVRRRYPVRLGEGAGIYRLRLPACPVTLHLTAPVHADATLEIEAGTRRGRVRMQPPLRRDKPGALLLRAPEQTPDFDLVVADDGGTWLRRAALRGGRAQLSVLPGRRLQVASIDAVDGRWVPKHTLKAFKPGERRTVRLGTRAAARLTVEVTPPVAGEVTLVDVEHQDLFTPQRAGLREGRAEFWVRPFREMRVAVEPPGAFFPHEGTFRTRRTDFTWRARLRPAARLRYAVADRTGHPVPFARARLWEPGRGGQMVLFTAPRLARGGADGVVFFDGVRGGEAALEITAPGFRARRFSRIRLEEGQARDGGAVALEPAGMLGGRVVDRAGRPVAGVKVRVLSPRVARLDLPGGGERLLYDLTEDAVGDAITDAAGRFDVLDESPRDPIVALFPGAGSGRAPMAFLPAPVLRVEGTAYVELDVPGSVEGVYVMLKRGRAVLVRTDPPLSLRPLPLLLPAGRHSLYVRLRDRRWAAAEFELEPGAKIRLTPRFYR